MVAFILVLLIALLRIAPIIRVLLVLASHVQFTYELI